MHVFQSSLKLEGAKALLRSQYGDEVWQIQDFEQFTSEINGGSLHPLSLSINPAELELYLRSFLRKRILGSVTKDNFGRYYKLLLEIKPTWPYYYSGLAQLSVLYGKADEVNIDNAWYFGKHEQQVVKSLAEVIFYGWNGLKKNNKNRYLSYLINQNEVLVSAVVNVSAKFAKIYVLCDFIYERKQVEYAACKSQYWQPLKEL